MHTFCSIQSTRGCVHSHTVWKISFNNARWKHHLLIVYLLEYFRKLWREFNFRGVIYVLFFVFLGRFSWRRMQWRFSWKLCRLEFSTTGQQSVYVYSYRRRGVPVRMRVIRSTAVVVSVLNFEFIFSAESQPFSIKHFEEQVVNFFNFAEFGMERLNEWIQNRPHIFLTFCYLWGRLKMIK